LNGSRTDGHRKELAAELTQEASMSGCGDAQAGSRRSSEGKMTVSPSKGIRNERVKGRGSGMRGKGEVVPGADKSANLATSGKGRREI